jgi:hypothetical protein
MDIFFERDGKKFMALEVDQFGHVLKAEELQEAQFEDIPNEQAQPGDGKISDAAGVANDTGQVSQ